LPQTKEIPSFPEDNPLFKENQVQYLQNDNRRWQKPRSAPLKTCAISQIRAANLRVLSINVDLLSCAGAGFIAQGARIT